MVVCHCEAINDRVILDLLDNGSLTLDDVAQRCGAGSRCGGCLETLSQVLDQHVGEIRSSATV